MQRTTCQHGEHSRSEEPPSRFPATHHRHPPSHGKTRVKSTSVDASDVIPDCDFEGAILEKSWGKRTEVLVSESLFPNGERGLSAPCLRGPSAHRTGGRRPCHPTVGFAANPDIKVLPHGHPAVPTSVPTIATRGSTPRRSRGPAGPAAAGPRRR